MLHWLGNPSTLQKRKYLFKGFIGTGVVIIAVSRGCINISIICNGVTAARSNGLSHGSFADEINLIAISVDDKADAA